VYSKKWDILALVNQYDCRLFITQFSIVMEKMQDCSGSLEVGYTSRLCTTAAWINDANSGCGSNGRDFSSGWNCTPMNQGWSSYSTISGKTPSGDRPEKRRPCCSSRSLYAVLTS